jgi:hypothetical protein
MSDPNEQPIPSNVTPIKKSRGNPKIKDNIRPKGPRKNETAYAIFKRDEYYLPGGIILGKPVVKIHRQEISELAAIAATWETIENLYQVSMADIKKHFDGVYNRGKALYEVNMLKKMHEKTSQGDGDMIKWMSKNRMKMADKIESTSTEVVPDEKEVTSKLSALLKKHGVNK